MGRIDRAYLLGAAKRDEILSLQEVEGYGRDSFGDPDYVTIYGLRPADWYARGVRLLGRTAVECTRDRLADRIGRDVAALAATTATGPGIVVVDPFAGSANTLVSIARHVGAARAIGFELDDRVHAATHRNLAIVGLDVELRHEPYETGLAALSVPADGLLVVFVAPPWGDALAGDVGLDLRATSPPVPAVVDLLAETFAARRVLVATQVYETVVPASLAAATARYAWSRSATYDLDAAGRNHGPLLGTIGWSPGLPP